MRLLASPIRQEVIDTLSALGGEADIATLAVELGRPADGLYYHCELLARGGLLQRMNDGAARRYRLIGDTGLGPQIDYSLSAQGREQLLRVVDGMLQVAGRDFREALEAGDAAIAGERRELWAGRAKGWADARDLAEINRLLTRLLALLHRPRAAGRDRLVSLCFLLAPVAAQPLRRNRRRSNGGDRD